MVNYIDDGLFFEDSLDKQLHIDSLDGTIHITNADIISESLSLTEYLCSRENLYFGSVESSCLKFTIRNTIPKMYKKWIVVTMELEGSETPFTIGRYRVWGEELSADKSTRTVTAYDGLYKILNNTYKRWYKGNSVEHLWQDGDTMTMKQFRDAWFERLHRTHTWISQETVSLPNDNVVIKKSKKIPRISGKDIFNAICEMNGVCGRLGRDNVFHYISLDDNNTTYPIWGSYTIDAEYEDFETTPIDRVEILAPDGEDFVGVGADADEAESIYTIENNFLIKGISMETTAVSAVVTIATNILNHIGNVTYTPFDANFKGNPCYEVGDRISFTAHGATVKTYILERVMTGIQSLHDNYMADTEGEYPESATPPNTLSATMQALRELQNRVDVVEDKEGGGGGGYIVAAKNELTVVNYIRGGTSTSTSS